MRTNINELKQALNDDTLTNDELLFLHLLNNVEQAYGPGSAKEIEMHPARSLRMFTVKQWAQGNESPKCIIVMDAFSSKAGENKLLFLTADVGMMARLARDFGDAAATLLEETDDWQRKQKAKK